MRQFVKVIALSISAIFSFTAVYGQDKVCLQKSVTYRSGKFSFSACTGDFNGDGKPDVAVVNYNGNDMVILINNGDGTFKAGGTYVTGHYPTSVKAADFNGDGKMDLAVSNVGSETISIFFGNGDGTFKPKQDF